MARIGFLAYSSESILGNILKQIVRIHSAGFSTQIAPNVGGSMARPKVASASVAGSGRWCSISVSNAISSATDI